MRYRLIEKSFDKLVYRSPHQTLSNAAHCILLSWQQHNVIHLYSLWGRQNVSFTHIHPKKKTTTYHLKALKERNNGHDLWPLSIIIFMLNIWVIAKIHLIALWRQRKRKRLGGIFLKIYKGKKASKMCKNMLPFPTHPNQQNSTLCICREMYIPSKSNLYQTWKKPLFAPLSLLSWKHERQVWNGTTLCSNGCRCGCRKCGHIDSVYVNISRKPEAKIIGTSCIT